MVGLTPKVIRILSLLEREPLYGKLIADTHPECFITPKHQEPGPAAVYRMMFSLEKRGLIERIHNYIPPRRRRRTHHQTISRAVWYRLTEKGQKDLDEARSILRELAEPAPKELPDQVPRPKQQREVL